MLSEITIIARSAVLRLQAEKLRELSAKIGNRSYRLEFEQGEGAFVKELEAMSEELRNVGSALSSLAAVTADRLDSAAAEFTAADEHSSGFYRGGDST